MFVSMQLNITTLSIMAMLEIWLNPFLHLALDRTELPTSQLGHFNSEKRAFSIHIVVGRWNLRFCGMLRGLCHWLVTDCSGQHVGLIFKDKLQRGGSLKS
jgi:hypothetical protein